MAGQMEVVGGGPSCLVARHESAPTIASRSSSMDADAYFVQPSPVLQMQMEMEPERQSQQHAQGQSSSTPWKAAQGQSIECTASANLTAQWKASTADPLFRALQTMFTAVPARGVKRSVLQDWNCADSPSLKRFRCESGTTARPPPTPIPPSHRSHPRNVPPPPTPRPPPPSPPHHLPSARHRPTTLPASRATVPHHRRREVGRGPRLARWRRRRTGRRSRTAALARTASAATTPATTRARARACASPRPAGCTACRTD